MEACLQVLIIAGVYVQAWSTEGILLGMASSSLKAAMWVASIIIVAIIAVA